MNFSGRLNKNLIEDVLALTPMQEGMLFNYLSKPYSNEYFEQLSLNISGNINMDCFGKAWNLVVGNNSSLRTIFRWNDIDNNLQLIVKPFDFKTKFLDFSEIVDKNEREKLLNKFKNDDLKNKFNLEDISFRIALCKMDENEYVMIMSSHHILFDGWSTGIIIKEFIDNYRAISNNEEVIKVNKTKYKEFVKYLKERKIQDHEKFWSEYLEGYEHEEIKPVVKEKNDNYIKESYSFNLESEKIQKYLMKENCTLASLMYTAWGILLQRYTNTDDIVFGYTVSGRNIDINKIEEVVGLFINTIPLRFNYNRECTFSEVNRSVLKDISLKTKYENDDLSNIKKYCGVNSSESLFESIIVVENYPIDKVLNNRKDNDFIVNNYEMVEETNFPLTLNIKENSNIDIILTYNTSLYSYSFIENMMSHLKNIINFIVESENSSAISHLEMLNENEKNDILNTFNKTEALIPNYNSIISMFEEQVDKTPDKIAVSAVLDGELAYRQLNEKANKLARILRGKGIKNDSIVCVMMEKSCRLIVSLYAVLKSGGAYLPIDTTAKKDRISFMIEDSKSKILLTDTELSNDIEAIKNKIEVINVSDEEMFKNIDGCNLTTRIQHIINCQTFHLSIYDVLIQF